MKLPDPWKCDECGGTKTPTNHWFIGLPADRYDIGGEHSVSQPGVLIVPWDDRLAEDKHARHLCGIECAQKHTGRELAKVYGNEVSPGGAKA